MEPVGVMSVGRVLWRGGSNVMCHTAGDLIEPEECRDDTRLPRTCPTNDSNVLAALDVH